MSIDLLQGWGTGQRRLLGEGPLLAVRPELDAEQGETVVPGSTNLPGSVIMIVADMSRLLAEVEVSAVMTHRKSMETVNAENAPQTVLEQVVASPFSRFPVWRGDPDTIVGVLQDKDLLAAVREHGRELVAAQHVVASILDPARAARLVEQHALDDSLPGLVEVLDVSLE